METTTFLKQVKQPLACDHCDACGNLPAKLRVFVIATAHTTKSELTFDLGEIDLGEGGTCGKSLSGVDMRGTASESTGSAGDKGIADGPRDGDGGAFVSPQNRPRDCSCQANASSEQCVCGVGDLTAACTEYITPHCYTMCQRVKSRSSITMMLAGTVHH